MNDSELAAQLKSVPLPERPAEYWNTFPVHVRLELRRTAPRQLARESWQSGFAWGTGVSFASFIISLIAFNQPLQQASNALFKNETLLRQQLAQLPNHLRRFMADEHGLHYLVAEKE
jgi:hypothetical protein